MPEQFEPEKQNLLDRYTVLEKGMKQRHEQERKPFVPEKELQQSKQEDAKKQEMDTVSDSQEKAAAMLEQYRQRQREYKERGHERDGHDR